MFKIGIIAFMRKNVISEIFPISLNASNVCHELFNHPEITLIYWLACLGNSLFAYLAFIYLFPFIQCHKTSAT